MTITVRDIAKKANVSIGTVSRALNNKQEGISEATRKRILEIVDEMEYQPNIIARSMITKKSLTIGLIVPDIRNPFFPELVRGVEDYASRSLYNVFLCNTDSDFKREREIINLMRDKQVDGIIYTNSYSGTSEQVKDLMYKYRIPAVFLDRGIQGENFSGVYIDNEKGGYIATEYLIELSHKKIGCITGPINIKNSDERIKGYMMALEGHNLTIDKELIISGGYQMEGGYEAAKRLLTHKKVTAIFALNDLMAFGVYQAAAEFGLKIPDDLSIIGFDNLKYNAILNPKLTTIDQSTYMMGKIAVDILLKTIKGESKEGYKSIFLEPKLVVRDSCKQLKGSSTLTVSKKGRNDDETNHY